MVLFKDMVLKALHKLKDKIYYIEDLVEKFHVFQDREDAGKLLANKIESILEKYDLSRVTVYAIPCGGVPVAIQLVKKFHALFDLIICRKIRIPWNPETGYGAVNPDGEYVLNEQLVQYLGFSEVEILNHVEKALSEIRRR